MKFLGRYLYSKLITLLLFAACAGIFAGVFILCGLPAAPVLYASAICGLLLLSVAILDFIRHYRRHRELERIKSLSAAMISDLPRAITVCESDCREIISNLCDECISTEQNLSKRIFDEVEYYTAWVHQIKTPIASMKLTLQNEDSPLSRKLSGDLRRIEQYVEMVLAFLRLDSTSTDYLFKEYKLDGIIRGAVKKFAPEFIDRKLTLSFSGTDKSALTDEKWLSFVIEQLISNALKYTPRGGVSIRVDDPCVLVIEDTGIGISPEDLPRVFEKGYTGYNGRYDKRASGLGLYLCRRICENLGVGIRITSKVDCGTSVYLDLSKNDLRTE